MQHMLPLPNILCIWEEESGNIVKIFMNLEALTF